MLKRNVLVLTSVLFGFNSLGLAQAEKPSEAIKYVTEYNRIADTYRGIVTKIANSKNANEFDENYHSLKAFIARPGADRYSNTALCMHLKSLPLAELEYVETIIDSSDTMLSLRDCQSELLNKAQFAGMWKTASFDLNQDIKNIKRIPFEEREVPNLDYLSMQGLKEKEVMLTFDDGPTQRTTVPILESLKKAGVKAAFFSTGRQALQNSELTQRILREGHLLGSHSFYHTLMMGRQVNRGAMSYDYFLSEFIGGHMGVFLSGGYIDPYFRFPNGCMNKNMRRNVTELGLKIFGWSIDSFDWQYPASKFTDADKRRELILQSFLKALRGSKNRGIVLMHDVFKQSAEALPLILNYLADNGYKVVLLKPANRNMQDRNNMPMVTQAMDFMTTHDLKITDIRPRVNSNGEPVSPLDYEPARFRYREMFPQLSYENSPIDPKASSCE
ncbi:polysaccharide deacetylase family protein [Bdellovibrio sp. 22V]|uniref:polysaccharide deacetylase family protein n=1 Tax=Bdellovibrio sp. 22V TaxID=3044166 RepID=UPI0025429AE5|nr:polysaccharide deacetylase family protein [Bdellovibrio sp. 22V]WII72494.1 polysaccharide deacetylase family protein [Bdellovibrio sp. 22V]